MVDPRLTAEVGSTNDDAQLAAQLLPEIHRREDADQDADGVDEGGGGGDGSDGP